MKLLSLFIAVSPVGSKFAKLLQIKLQDKVINKIYRVDHEAAARKRTQNKMVFTVTRNTLNKLEQLHAFTRTQVSCPPYTDRIEDVGTLGGTIFARTLLNSHGGNGIREFTYVPGEPYPPAPLYTRYIPKKAEFRIHVFNGEVIDAQQKRRRKGVETTGRIRNLENGYVFTRGGLVLPDGIGALAIAAVNSVGYQYGAVDIIYNEKQNKCFVLEVNSRPGVEGTTLENYADAIIKQFNLTRKQS